MALLHCFWVLLTLLTYCLLYLLYVTAITKSPPKSNVTESHERAPDYSATATCVKIAMLITCCGVRYIIGHSEYSML